MPGGTPTSIPFYFRGIRDEGLSLPTGAALGPDQGTRQAGHGVSDRRLAKVRDRMPAGAARIRELFRSYDALITPLPTAQLPVEIGHPPRPADDQRDGERLSLWADLELHRPARSDDPRRGSPRRAAASPAGAAEPTRRRWAPRRQLEASGPGGQAARALRRAHLDRRADLRSWGSAAISMAPVGPPSSDQRWWRARGRIEEVVGVGAGREGTSAAVAPHPPSEGERVGEMGSDPNHVSGCSLSVYWQSWISRSASPARSKPEIHSGSSVSRGRRARARDPRCR